MPRISERGTLSSGTTLWSVNRFSDMIWGFINIVVFYFKSLVDPLINPGNDSRGGSSRSGSGRGPPRPPGRGNFRTFADAFGGSDSIPPPPPGG